LDWIKHIHEDADTALTELYRASKQPCVDWLISKKGLTPNDAVEIFQISIVILYDNVRTNKLTTLTSHVNTYIYAIANNKAQELFRKNKKELRQEHNHLTFQNYVMEETDGNEELETQIQQSISALESLGDPCKSILKHYYLDEMNMSDITQKMGYKNADTTKNQKYKCLKRLQSLFPMHKEKTN